MLLKVCFISDSWAYLLLEMTDWVLSFSCSQLSCFFPSPRSLFSSYFWDSPHKPQLLVQAPVFASLVPFVHKAFSIFAWSLPASFIQAGGNSDDFGSLKLWYSIAICLLLVDKLNVIFLILLGLNFSWDFSQLYWPSDSLMLFKMSFSSFLIQNKIIKSRAESCRKWQHWPDTLLLLAQ